MTERRLAAIMFTDMVGYTALGQSNEPLSLALVEEQRKIVRTILANNRGREIKTIGDGLLAEFPSALEAVSCAMQIQRAMDDRNKKVTQDQRMRLRIAVHLGDVEHRDGDIYGDAVNVASRIQAFTDPGGICITSQVYDHIRNRQEFQTESIGRHELKNVRVPVEMYKVLPPDHVEQLAEDSTLEPRRIAALPLSMISSDPQDEYLADGLTEEIINTLSSISGLRVIARTSVMKYKGVKKSIGEIGQELRVGSVLEGSVRKAGGRLRITAQLIDVGSEEHLWSEKYDRDVHDVFAVQTEIAEKVADALKSRLLKDDMNRIERRAPDNFEAYSLYLRGRYYWNKRTREGLEKAIEFFERAIQQDKEYALAYAGMADCYTLMGRHHYMPSQEALAKAGQYADQALQIDEKLAEPHASLAGVLMNRDLDWKGAEDELRRALGLNPNYAVAHYWYSVLLLTTGRLDEAVVEAEKAQALDPFSPVLGMGVVLAYLSSRRYDRAIEECVRFIDMSPGFIPAHDFLVHLYVYKKMFREAEAEARKMMELGEVKVEGLTHLAYAYAASGRTDEAKRLLEESSEDPQLDLANPTIFVTVYSILGDKDRAFEWAQKVFESHRLAFPSLRFSPDLKEFRDDERYKSLLLKAGLELYM